MLCQDSSGLSGTPPLSCRSQTPQESTPATAASQEMGPYSASVEYLEACGIDSSKFMEWRVHAEAAGLDDDWEDVLPVYFRAQAKRAKEDTLGEDAVEDMITLGVTPKAAQLANRMGWTYGHRSPYTWAEMLVRGMMARRRWT
ncbi:hypothetical protein Agub_g9170 [Astrephomene gubernaculifera]|uniref:Uncharacterized protein n=1 Tax=Astrephomene gubernaculifera TaxID=47775 RepID=A0AAD3DX69_9CHLO|nr:hypothetical protein Agub_g9170 [Astrephomene gubernaculifera]